jgi:anti-sigma-K factor RskA
MTTSRLPENWEELTTDYVFGNLSAQDAKTVEHLLTADPELQTDILRLQEILGLLPYSLPQPTPPPALRSTILAAAQTDTVSAARTIDRRRNRWLVTSAVAATLLVALAVDNYRLRQQIQSHKLLQSQVQTLQQASTQVYALKGTGEPAAARGSVFFNVDQQEALVAVQDLPDLPPEQIYRLWALTAAGQVFFVGQFDTTTGSTTIETLAIAQRPNLPVTELRITQELVSTPLVPKGQAVMTSAL